MMEKPKRPMSAYLLWLNSARAQIKQDHPGLKVTEVAKKAGELWRAMEDKSTWEQRAAAAKEQYTQDLDAFYGEGGGTPPKRGQKRQSQPRQTKTGNKRAAVKDEPADIKEDPDEDDEEPTEVKKAPAAVKKRSAKVKKEVSEDEADDDEDDDDEEEDSE